MDVSIRQKTGGIVAAGLIALCGLVGVTAPAAAAMTATKPAIAHSTLKACSLVTWGQAVAFLNRRVNSRQAGVAPGGLSLCQFETKPLSPQKTLLVEVASSSMLRKVDGSGWGAKDEYEQSFRAAGNPLIGRRSNVTGVGQRSFSLAGKHSYQLWFLKGDVVCSITALGNGFNRPGPPVRTLAVRLAQRV